MILTKEHKKSLKKLAVKYLIKKSYKQEMKGLLNIFIRDNDYGSGKNYYLFEGNNLKEIINELEKFIDIDGVNLTPSAYDCTGRYFSYPIEIKILSENRVLISQSWGLDV
jgi:Mor family transcriptional regulator